MIFVISPDPIPIATDAIVKAIAKRKPTTPVIKTNPSGLINGDEVRNAIIGPQGSVVVSIPMSTAVVPQAQSGVNAPNATLAMIDNFFLRNNTLLNFSVFK